MIRRALRGTQVAEVGAEKGRNVWSSGNTNVGGGGGAAGNHHINVPTVRNDVVVPHAWNRVTEPRPLRGGQRSCGGVSARQAAVETDCD